MSAPDWQREGRDWPNAEASRFLTAGGVRWHVQVMGDGPVALLLHGTGAATHSWRDLAPLLAANFTVVAPDLPGHGFTSAMRRPTPEAVATAVTALTSSLNLPPALVIGHSAGAAVALTMAERADTQLRGVVGLGGALLPFPGMAGKLFPAMARMLFVNPFMPELLAMRARVPGEIASFLHRSTGSRLDQRGIDLYERLLRTSGHCGGALALMANWDLQPLQTAMPLLQTPVLLLHGERDTTIPPATSSTVASRLPTATTHFLPGLGHLAHEEAPQDHKALILDFARQSGIIMP
jgi:magnesium chelatase accessory protein